VLGLVGRGRSVGRCVDKVNRVEKCEFIGDSVEFLFVSRKCKLNNLICWNYANPTAIMLCSLRKFELDKQKKKKG